VPTFAYQAVDARGKRTRGHVTASTENALVRDLASRGLTLVDVREAQVAQQQGGFVPGRRRAVLDFTRAVAALLPAGMPLARALSVAASTSSPSIRPALDRVRERVERGEELARSLSEEPGLFNPLYAGMVRAGEKGGALARAFERLGTYLEREDELRSKLVSMSIYPVMLTLVGIASVMVLVLFVMPRFAQLLANSGAPLPAMTSIVLGTTTSLRENWRILAMIAAGIVALLVWARTAAAGRTAAAHFLANAPLIGPLRRSVLAARFSRMTGELLTGGAPLLSALQDTEQCIEDPLARAVTIRVRTRVREGSALNHALAEHGLFPPELIQLVALGEESGKLSDFLLKSAELLERRTERALERLVALVEPAMIVTFGAIIAVVALALLQAIYGVNSGSLS
jgi:general secretion pathway protein F